MEYYREYYAPVGIYENQVYEGLEKMLAALKEKGLSLCVATSKPERFAKMILDHFHLDSYFDLIGGALMDGRTDKAEVISYVLAQLDTKKEKVVMVGDREHDVLGARKNGLDSIGVLFGYGNEEELKEAGADWIAKDMTELGNLLLTLAE